MADAGDPRRRAQILRAAERLLEHYGFGKTTVADIAREAKIGVGTVYLEFKSKDAIVSELSVQRYRCVLDAMRRAAQGDGDAATRLRAVLDIRIAKLSRYARKGQHGRDLIQCGVCPGIEAVHARFRAEEEDLVTTLLDTAARAGELAADEPRDSARVLLRLYESYSLALSSAPKSAALRREIAAAHELMLAGLLPRRRK